jgi:monovalent cation/hydrogen antiporter
VRLSNERLARVGIQVLDADTSPEAKVLHRELRAQLEEDEAIMDAPTNSATRFEALRTRVVAEQRRVLLEMRSSGEIGDDAFHQVEARLDLAELNAQGASE